MEGKTFSKGVVWLYRELNSLLEVCSSLKLISAAGIESRVQESWIENKFSFYIFHPSREWPLGWVEYSTDYYRYWAGSLVTIFQSSPPTPGIFSVITLICTCQWLLMANAGSFINLSSKWKRNFLFDWLIDYLSFFSLSPLSTNFFHFPEWWCFIFKVTFLLHVKMIDW